MNIKQLHLHQIIMGNPQMNTCFCSISEEQKDGLRSLANGMITEHIQVLNKPYFQTLLITLINLITVTSKTLLIHDTKQYIYSWDQYVLEMTFVNKAWPVVYTTSGMYQCQWSVILHWTWYVLVIFKHNIGNPL